MARQVQLRRGTTAQTSSFTGAVGEVTVDTDKDVVVIHDGSTAGGFPSVKATSLATVATTGAYADVTGTPTLATVATTGAYADVTGTPTLATVATTGAYADVTGTPTLGTAAAADTGDFATAAQGTLADSAIQSGDLATVATTGAYADVTGTPTIPVAGVDVLAYDANLQSFVTALTLPTSDGTSGQALVTDGSGTISFGSAGISTGKAIAMAIVFG